MPTPSHAVPVPLRSAAHGGERRAGGLDALHVDELRVDAGRVAARVVVAPRHDGAGGGERDEGDLVGVERDDVAEQRLLGGRDVAASSGWMSPPDAASPHAATVRSDLMAAKAKSLARTTITSPSSPVNSACVVEPGTPHVTSM